MKKFFVAALLVMSLSGTASAYYHFVHFPSRNAPFHGVPEKFDVNALPGKTLTFFVADTSNLIFGANDSAAALLSQIKAAAGVWNDVDSSDLRLAYGGVSPAVPSATPSVDVVFDAPPGVVAYGGPTVPAGSNGQFVPILKSVVHVNPDFTFTPSWSESLFTTLVHEMGHALGLQHSFTSGVMATRETRSTTRSKPLAADDIAGISILYPKGILALTTGSISGRVTMSGNGVNLASVVAIAPNGAAISTLTNPDGTYQIDGLPQRSYYIYVHPLPPALDGQPSPGDVLLPVDANGRTFTGSAPFETVFYTPGGGVNNSNFASLVPANIGQTTQNINFSVRQRNGYAINSVRTYAFPGAFAVWPAFISPSMQNPFVVAAGQNLLPTNVRATTIGGPDLTTRPYANAPSAYVQLDFDQRTLAIPSNGPRHVVLSANNDIYVLPSAFYHVERQPPVIQTVVPGLDGLTRTAQITGLNLTPDTRIVFDGVAAQIRNYEELPAGVVRITVAVPAGVSSYRAVVAAFNADGQSSLSVQGDNPPSYTYPADTLAAAPTALLASPSLLSPGTEAMLQIDGLNTQFADGQVAIGFGTPDVVVRRVWVVNPTRVVANVIVASNAQPAILNLTVTSGLVATTYPLAAGIQPVQPRSFWLTSSVQNTNGGSSVIPGGFVTMTVGATPVTLTTANTTVVINDTLRTQAIFNGSQFSFILPQSTPAGLVTVRLESGSDRSQSIAIWVDGQPSRATSEPNIDPQRATSY